MGGRTTSRILISATFLVTVMIGANVRAQTGALPPTGISRGGQNHAGVEHNPACQRIISECERLGFIQGRWKEDNGLWRDCFDPVVKGGGHATRDGKPIRVPVNPGDVRACRASEGHHPLVR